MMNTQTAAPLNNPIPEGFKQDGQGRLIPLSLIKPIDLERDRLVGEIVEKGKQVKQTLAQFKEETLDDIRAFVELSHEQYGAKIGGKKGNLNLLSFDGRYKVQVAVSDSIEFDERLQAARALIDACLTEWTQGARPELMALVNDAFRADIKGEIRVGRVLALRRLEITDKRWQQAMQAIGEACQVVGSKQYIRLYERLNDDDKYEPIALDLASIALPALPSPLTPLPRAGEGTGERVRRITAKRECIEMAAVFTNKNAQIAKIHIAKTQLNMDDETYRAFLQRVAGVKSSKQLTPKQLGRVLFELEKLGFKPTTSKKAGRARPRLPQSRTNVLSKIEALLAEAGRPFAYADGMALQMFERERLEWLTDRELYKLMQALIIDANRRKRTGTNARF